MLWLIAAGGAAGSVTRFLLGKLVQDRVDSGFPLGTLVVNVSGSFLLALFMEYALARPEISRDTRALIATGFVGGYTTFSTFSYETLALLRGGDYRRALLYLTLSIMGALAGAAAGFVVAREALSVPPGT